MSERNTIDEFHTMKDRSVFDVMEKATVTVTTTRARLEALCDHLANDYLGHTKREELVRELLNDIKYRVSK